MKTSKSKSKKNEEMQTKTTKKKPRVNLWAQHVSQDFSFFGLFVFFGFLRVFLFFLSPVADEASESKSKKLPSRFSSLFLSLWRSQTSIFC